MPRRLAVAIAIVALAAACASDPAHRQRVAAQETARMHPPSVPLTTFGSFEILQVAMSPEVSVKPEKAAAANELAAKLEARIRPLLQSWEASAPPEARAHTLQIQATVVSLRIVGGATRFFAGALAGDSGIDVDLTLVEKETGRQIANERIHQTASAMSGAWSIGSSDQNLSEYIVDIAHQYLASNHKP